MAELEVTIDGSGARRGAKTVTRSLDDIRKKTDGSSAALKNQARSVDSVEKAMTSLRRVAAPLIAAFGAQAILQTVNSYQALQNSLRVVTDSTEELAIANERLFQISQETRQPLEATTQLYSRASIAAKELGASQEQLFDLVEITGQALAVQGGAASESAGALRQLSQAFSSGIVRAEEFNSILEGAFPLAQAAARGIDEAAGSVGKLRKLVVEGEITSREFFEAILKGGEELGDQFAQTQVTVGQALTTVENSFLRLVGTAFEATGASDTLATALVGVAGGLNDLTSAFQGTLGPEEELSSGLQVFTTVALVATQTIGILGRSLFTTLTTPFKVAGEAIGGTAAALVAFAKGEFSQAASIMDEVTSDAADTTIQNFTELRDEMIGATSETIESLVELWDAGARDIGAALESAAPAADGTAGPTIDPEVTAEAQKLSDALDDLADSIIRQVDPLVVFEQELAQLDELLITGRITEEQFNAALAQTSATYAAATPEGQAYNAMLAEGAQITEAALTPAEEYANTVNNLAALLEGGFISQETFNRSVEESAAKLKDATGASSELAGFLEQTSIQAARNIQSAFADFLFDPFDEGLSGLVSNFADALRKMAAEALSQQILSGILNVATAGAGGEAGGILGAIAGAFTTRQTGGPLVAGQESMVGERGQEAFVPREAGQVTSNRELRQGAGAAPNVNVPVEIINITDPSAIPAAMESA
ncbi:MAG: tape measure protein, partial [bacterium]|nr:tape measure protein [bacterium]